MRLVNYLTGIEGVAASQTATINCPINRRYHQINLFYTAAGVAADVTLGISRVRISVGGTLMRNLTPAQILAIAALNFNKWVQADFAPALGELPIYFSEPWRASVVGEEATSWPIYSDLGTPTFTVQIDFTAVAAPGLSALAVFDYARNVSDNQQFLTPIKQLPFAYNVPTGIFDITTLPINFPIQRIHLFGASAITNIEVVRDSEKVQESTVAQNARILAAHGLDGAGITGLQFPIVFDLDQQLSSPLVVSRDLDVRITSAAGQTVTAIVEQRADAYR
jgi:Viral coat protein P2 N-terminal domain